MVCGISHVVAVINRRGGGSWVSCSRCHIVILMKPQIHFKINNTRGDPHSAYSCVRLTGLTAAAPGRRSSQRDSGRGPRPPPPRTLVLTIDRCQAPFYTGGVYTVVHAPRCGLSLGGGQPRATEAAAADLPHPKVTTGSGRASGGTIIRILVSRMK
eukprot:SAG31_NODE_538_length_14312_cov_12.542461_12_plen_156_part_00